MAKKPTRALLRLAGALNVTPAEALRIARHFVRSQSHDSTEAQLADDLRWQLGECCAVGNGRDHDDAARDTLRAIERHGRAFVPVLQRYREVRRARKLLRRDIWDGQWIGNQLDSLPGWVFSQAPDSQAAAKLADRARALAAELQALMQKADGDAERPPETLGF